MSEHMHMNQNRVRTLKQGKTLSGPVVYWMSRDQRVKDNWALLYAQDIALKKKVPLLVVFCLVPDFLGATVRQYSFMLNGLISVEKDLLRKEIGFCLLQGSPEQELPQFIADVRCSFLVTDFDPLRIKKRWKDAVASRIDMQFDEVDAHNIIPCWLTSGKREYAAYTIRPKIKRLLPEYLTEFPPVRKHPFQMQAMASSTDWELIKKKVRTDVSVSEVDWLLPGERAASSTLREFMEGRLEHYTSLRNDPAKACQSNLSPYLHFGHISAQRTALEIRKAEAKKADKEAFLEELIVRRELSDNFCFYNDNYDNCSGFPEWAQKTLHVHRKDRREFLYTREQLEHAKTHDELWNAAQREMLTKGKMHGYLRMYWAKKILEWTASPVEAMEIAVYLNDRYELDGRDPNGYAGIAWCIGGVHDRAWNERKIFGKIRYMSYNGCRSKFDIKAYITSVGNRK